jgi:hypothetical protein
METQEAASVGGVLGAEPRIHKDGDGRATRQSCPGCMKGGHQMPHKKFAQQCIQIVGFRLEVIWQTLQ